MRADDLLESGRAHQRAGRLAEAEAISRQLLAEHPHWPEALHLLGVVAHQAGQPAAGAQLIARALALRPEYEEALRDLCAAFLAEGRVEETIAACREALAAQPDFAEAHLQLANALAQSGRGIEARPHYEAVLRARPDSAEALNHLGQTYDEAGELARALPYYEAALQVQPHFGRALSNLGSALTRAGREEEGERCLQAAVRVRPADVPTWVNLGFALLLQEKWAEARAAYEAALRLAPGYGPACDGMGTWCSAQGDSTAALAWHRRALVQAPQDPPLHWDLAQTLLLRGEFAEGWEEYEWRWRCFPAEARNFAAPLWHGEPLAGRTILLHAEQGAGDTFQMARYLPLVAARGGRVVLEGPPALAPLLRGLSGVKAWITAGETLPPFDLHCPLMSLPRAFGTRLETIPAPARSLTAPEEKRQHFRERLAGETRRKIGLVWAGAPHRKNRQRSASLRHLAPLLGLPGIRWFSVQKGPPAGQAREFPALTDWTEDLLDFGDTAALLENMDLLITVETGVAHLAGALGRPVWTLLPFAPDWRWGEHGERSPWYPTMRLFRQRAPHGWREVVERVEAALREEAP